MRLADYARASSYRASYSNSARQPSHTVMPLALQIQFL
jgi:hypothetical protein